MSILLRVERESGGQPIKLGNGQITGYNYTNTSPADFLAKAYNAEHSIQIRGEIPLRLLPPVEQDTDNSNTLYAWALTEYRPGNDYYRSVTVRIVRHEKTIREVKFTHAYVHIYQKEVNGLKGVLEFELVVRQKRDQLDSIQFGTAESMQQKFKKEKRDHFTILSGASKIEFAESTRSIRYAYAEEAFGIEGGSSSDSSQTWCRAIIDGITYSDAAPCDNSSHCVKIPKDLQEILNDPEKRIKYVDKFFKKYQGKHYPNPSTNEIKINFGKDIVGFMEWELNSTRIAKSTESAYWKSINAQMIADIYWAQQAFITKPGTKQEEIWSEYEIRWKKFMSTPNQALWNRK
ncbi:hypothetical protein SAMN04487970_105119 [Paenibacillus tianmuensis]|uniref:Uncharacterized protein n=1 Tax=Paenibacillus tianmuensis TaxID=624147 RepID=A0A1G4TFY9_9BACL|nr:hypothetical protein [Paenibacillus tianmuensis]SCW80268.1 hypothetical protein SAMN04487970_105119 [Paenibacillus tianmuensis]